MTPGAELTRRSPARWSARRVLAANLVAILTLSLAGCVETVSDVSASLATTAAPQARALGSPRAATAAFTQLEGAPPAVLARFIAKLATETRSRDISPVQPDVAKYIVHGYLSASKTSGGVVLGYVWDVFDSRKARIQRIEDQVTAVGSAADPWSLADDRTLDSLAAKSADDLAALLSTMPEAADASGAAPSSSATQPPRASLAGSSALR